MKTFNTCPLKYALSNTGITKARAAPVDNAGSAQLDAYIRDMWSLCSKDMAIENIEPYWKISLAISRRTHTSTVTGYNLTTIDVRAIYKICLQNLPKLTELEMADTINHFNGNAISHVPHDMETLVNLLGVIDKDVSISSIYPVPIHEQRYLLELLVRILDVVRAKTINFCQIIASHGYYSFTDEDGFYIKTSFGKVYC